MGEDARWAAPAAVRSLFSLPLYSKRLPELKREGRVCRGRIQRKYRPPRRPASAVARTEPRTRRSARAPHLGPDIAGRRGDEMPSTGALN